MGSTKMSSTSRRLSKRLPMSTDLDVFERDETLAAEPQQIEQPAPAAPVSRLDALEQQIGANDGQLSDDNPTAGEGRSEDQMGEDA